MIRFKETDVERRVDADPTWEVQGIRKTVALQDLEGTKVSWE